jgi:hypothetical protein
MQMTKIELTAKRRTYEELSAQCAKAGDTYNARLYASYAAQADDEITLRTELRLFSKAA